MDSVGDWKQLVQRRELIGTFMAAFCPVRLFFFTSDAFCVSIRLLVGLLWSCFVFVGRIFLSVEILDR